MCTYTTFYLYCNMHLFLTTFDEEYFDFRVNKLFQYVSVKTREE